MDTSFNIIIMLHTKTENMSFTGIVASNKMNQFYYSNICAIILL